MNDPAFNLPPGTLLSDISDKRDCREEEDYWDQILNDRERYAEENSQE